MDEDYRAVRDDLVRQRAADPDGEIDEERMARGFDVAEAMTRRKANVTGAIVPIETHYAGCRFRSRLEARWAVFFDHMGIEWQYEPQGFYVNQRPYLPDFLLPECGTWIEVKGCEEDLDRELMEQATHCLPPAQEGYPTILLLGPIPGVPPGSYYGWGWIGLEPRYDPDGDPLVMDSHWSFTPTSFPEYPVRLADTSSATAMAYGGPLLEPTGDMASTVNLGNLDLEPNAYRAARSARFEHGERG